MKLSIVIATLNRLPYLKKCIASIGPSCEEVEHEIIVVDGGSKDGSLEWLRSQRNTLFVIEQGASYGAVYAFNAGFYAVENDVYSYKGFDAAKGDYVAALNDDCVLVGPTLRLACDYLDSHPKTGQVAIPWHDTSENFAPHVMPVVIGKQQVEVIYANFGVTRRWLGDKVGWWGKWEHYAGDCELSFNILMEGYTVDELVGGVINHFRVQDATRKTCYHNSEFMQKWMTLDVSFLMPDNTEKEKEWAADFALGTA